MGPERRVLSTGGLMVRRSRDSPWSCLLPSRQPAPLCRKPRRCRSHPADPAASARRGTATVAGNQQPSIFMRLQRIQAFKYSSGRRRREAVGARRKGKKCRERASSRPCPPRSPPGHVRGQKGVLGLETRHPSVRLPLVTLRGPGSCGGAVMLAVGVPRLTVPGARRRALSSCLAPAHIWPCTSGGEDPCL